jgi:hypothetical protein
VKIVHREDIVRKGALAQSPDIITATGEVEQAIKEICWPSGADGFYLNPSSKGKGRGEGNGVKPIKEACITYLKSVGWKDELRVRTEGVAGTGPLDAVKETPHGLFAVEWETGNISSSHRALNKICLGVLTKELAGGVLVLPSNNLYPFLTDRIGNYRELAPYLPLWESVPYTEGVIFLMVVEQDGLRDDAPRIPKGTDGRALL